MTDDTDDDIDPRSGAQWDISRSKSWLVVHRLLNDPNSARSLGNWLRQRRWERLLERFPDLASMRILDVGGSVAYWQRAPVQPDVVLLNIAVPLDSPTDHLRFVQGDACDPPAALRRERFDLVYSNSMIEHVGGHSKRVEVAKVIQSLAPAYWVQTPYRYFPIEPHWLFPGFQFLPPGFQVKAAGHWPLAWSRPRGRVAVADVLSVELLGRTEMHYLFPDAALVDERVLGLCKSLIAVRQGW